MKLQRKTNGQNTSSPKPAYRNLFSPGLRLLATMAIGLVLGSTAQAQNSPNEYIPDMSYHEGLMTHDVPHDSGDRDNIGRKAVKLPNGDVVIVGRVPLSSGGTDGIGLVLRDANGQPKNWANPDPAHGTGSTIIIPRPGGLFHTEVKGVAVMGDHIFVLSDVSFGSNLYAQDFADIHVIGTNGRLKHVYATDPVGVPLGSQMEGRALTANGIVAWGAGVNTGIAIVMSITPLSANSQKYFRYESFRFNPMPTGSFSRVTSKNSQEIFPQQCGGQSDCVAGGIAMGGRDTDATIHPFSIPPKIYITGGRRANSSSPWEVFTARIKGNTGEGNGFSYMHTGGYCFSPGGTLTLCPTVKGIGTAIAVDPIKGTASNDKIFAITREPLACGDGVRVMSINNLASILTQSSVVVGGTEGTRPFCPLFQTAFFGHALDYTDGKLAIAGTRRNLLLCIPGGNCDHPEDGALAVLDRDLNTLAPVDYYEYLRMENGNLVRTTHSGFYSVSSLGNDRYLLGGHIRIPRNAQNGADKHRFTSLVVKNEYMFRDGFE